MAKELTKELSPEMKENLSKMIESIADTHIVGKPALLATGLFYSTEKYLIGKINEIENLKD